LMRVQPMLPGIRLMPRVMRCWRGLLHRDHVANN
jgi:hypothetical protein